MIFRRATLKDLDPLCRLRSQLADDPEDRLTTEYAPYNAKRDKAWLQRLLRAHQRFVLIAEEKGIIYACSIVSIEKIPPKMQAYYTYRTKALLVHLYVDKNHRRHGIGRALTEYTLQYLMQKDVEFMDLECYMYNKKAAKLYNKIGFHDVFMTKRFILNK